MFCVIRLRVLFSCSSISIQSYLQLGCCLFFFRCGRHRMSKLKLKLLRSRTKKRSSARMRYVWNGVFNKRDRNQMNVAFNQMWMNRSLAARENVVFPVPIWCAHRPTKSAMNQLKFCKSAKGSGQSNFSSLDRCCRWDCVAFFSLLLLRSLDFALMKERQSEREAKKEKNTQIRKQFAEMPEKWQKRLKNC